MAERKAGAEKVRTTVYFDKGLLKRLKRSAIDEEKSVTEILEELARKKVG